MCRNRRRRRFVWQNKSFHITRLRTATTCFFQDRVSCGPSSHAKVQIWCLYCPANNNTQAGRARIAAQCAVYATAAAAAAVFSSRFFLVPSLFLWRARACVVNDSSSADLRASAEVSLKEHSSSCAHSNSRSQFERKNPSVVWFRFCFFSSIFFFLSYLPKK